MRFGTLLDVWVFVAMQAAAWPVLWSGWLHPAVTGLYAIGWLAGWWPGRPRFGAKAVVAASIALLAVQGVRLALGADAAALFIEFAVLLSAAKWFTRDGAADYQQIAILAFLCQIAATITTYDVSFAVSVTVFITALPVALSLIHLRVQIAHRFAKDPAAQRRLLQSTRVVTWKYVFAVSAMAVPIVVTTLALFFAIPRLGMGVGRSSLSARPVAGFSSEVDIGDLAQTIADDTTYLRVWTPGQAPQPRLPVYFRGAVFDVYAHGRWRKAPGRTTAMPHLERGWYWLDAPRPIAGNAPTWRIMQRPTDPSLLFLPVGTAAVRTDPQMRSGIFRPRRIEVTDAGEVRYFDSTRVGIRYDVVLQGGGAHGTESPRPEHLRVPGGIDWDAVDLPVHRDPHAAAGAVAAYLLRNHRYVRVPPGGAQEGDGALRRFLFEDKVGNCEHFATAAALLLRRSGVPTRLVTGFLGAVWNPAGGYYQVRADAAHAWVEYFDGSRWVFLDPTPPAPVGAAAEEPGLWERLGQWMDVVQMRWQRYILDYDMEAQRSAARTVRARLPRISPAQWRWGLGAALLVAGAWWLWRGRRPAARRRSASSRVAHGLGRALERRLARSGVERAPGQTMAQYARAVRSRCGVDASSAVALWEAFRYGPPQHRPAAEQVAAAIAAVTVPRPGRGVPSAS